MEVISQVGGTCAKEQNLSNHGNRNDVDDVISCLLRVSTQHYQIW